jgi:hypothetical protein
MRQRHPGNGAPHESDRSRLSVGAGTRAETGTDLRFAHVSEWRLAGRTSSPVLVALQLERLD